MKAMKKNDIGLFIVCSALFKSIPALCGDGEFIAAFGLNMHAQLRCCKIANRAYLFVEYQLVIILLPDGEQQLIIFTATQSAGRWVYIKFKSGIAGIVGNRNFLFIQYTTHIALG